MTEDETCVYPVLSPDLQISFYYRLQTARGVYLREGLQRTVAGLSIERLNAELAAFVSPAHLARVASFGLRGEVIFPVPYLLETNPYLLGYYRLLYGVSQKTFYGRNAFKGLQALEERGHIPPRLKERLPAVCRSLVKTGEALTDGLDSLSVEHVNDLQLLTLGPSLRGGELNRIGQEAGKEVFGLIRAIVGPYIVAATESTILLENASGREVLMVFADDPDVRVLERLPSGEHPCVSMEIKGGVDASNVYNRLGEAEKSHSKARQAGFFEFWTLVRAEFDLEKARVATPTTSRFFRLDRIVDPATAEHGAFRDHLCAILGVPTT